MVDEVIQQMCELTPDNSEHHLTRGAGVASLLRDIKLCFTLVIDAAKERKQAQLAAAAAAATAAAAGVAAAAGAPGAGAAAQRRVREAIGLKPKRLAHDAEHIALQEWLRQFRRYYHASHFRDGNDDEKHGYFLASPDLELRASIQPLVSDNAVIFQPTDVNHLTSLEAHLWWYYDTALSIFVRRHHLFTMEFHWGEADFHFNTRLRAQVAECDLANLGVNNHISQPHQRQCVWHNNNNKLEAIKARRRCLSTRSARPLAMPLSKRQAHPV
jgi:hypothetical protein